MISPPAWMDESNTSCLVVSVYPVAGCQAGAIAVRDGGGGVRSSSTTGPPVVELRNTGGRVGLLIDAAHPSGGRTRGSG